MREYILFISSLKSLIQIRPLMLTKNNHNLSVEDVSLHLLNTIAQNYSVFFF